MTRVRRAGLMILLFLLAARRPAPARAELWPVPARTPQTPVPCADCLGGQPGPTVGYQASLQTFTGRFLDSSGASTWFLPFRTARASKVLIMPALDRVYFLYGSGTVAAYELGAFFSRLESGEPLVFPLPVPADRGGQPEKFLRWDAWFNPEMNSAWKTFNIDGDVRVAGFDVDDQGYVYLAATIYGWGIVKDGLSRAGGPMESLFQDRQHLLSQVISLKGLSRYYMVGGGLWDVTDRARPSLLPGPAIPFSTWAKTADAGTVALLDSFGSFKIATADGLAAGSFLYTSTGTSYRFVTGDGANFFAYKMTADPAANVIRGSIAVFIPSGSTYQLKGEYPIDALPQITNLRAGGGYLVMTGSDAGGSWDLRVFRLEGLVPKPLSLAASPADPSYPSYFRSYYGFAPPGYAAPQYINMLDGAVYRPPSGAPYLFVCAKGLGDVYRLAEDAVQPLSAAVASPAEGAVVQGAPTVEAQVCGDAAGADLFDGATRLGAMAPAASSAVTP